ncbi:MAG: TetR/AcrR family transcriptional regulator [Anaerococcus sp.]
MKEMTNRQKQANKTKKNIMDTSWRLIKEYGYDSVTIKQICEEASVSTGAFYHHLRNKDEIIIEGYLECDNYFDEYVIHNLKSKNAIDKILEYMEHQTKYAEKLGINLMTQIYRAQLIENNDFFLSDERALPRHLIELIQEAQEQGALSADYQSKQICHELLLISRGVIFNWSLIRGDFNLSEYCKEIILNHLHCFMVDNRN